MGLGAAAYTPEHDIAGAAGYLRATDYSGVFRHIVFHIFDLAYVSVHDWPPFRSVRIYSPDFIFASVSFLVSPKN